MRTAAVCCHQLGADELVHLTEGPLLQVVQVGQHLWSSKRAPFPTMTMGIATDARTSLTTGM